jgi:hypothetical protein
LDEVGGWFGVEIGIFGNRRCRATDCYFGGLRGF